MRRAALGLLLTLGTAACETGTTMAPTLEPRVVVHVVLDPMSSEQVVIVERTKQSRFTDSSTAASPNPIIASGGLPISGATVSITRTGGESAVAVEDAGARGAGLYRIRSTTPMLGSSTPSLNALQIVPGARYELRVVTPLGTVRGHTRVPLFSGTADTRAGVFNVDTDTLRLAAPNDLSIAGYLVRHGTQSGQARERYLPRLTGPLLLPADPGDDDAWAFSFSRQDIRPGTTQSFVVAAVDSNVFRYYVGGFDPFGDDTQGNTLEGGVGLFGSMVMLINRPLDLIAVADKPIEQQWTAQTRPVGLPSELRLYESPRFPGFGDTATLIVAGTGRASDGQRVQVTGIARGQTVQLTVALRTGALLATVTGTLAGTSLTLEEQRTRERMVYRGQ